MEEELKEEVLIWAEAVYYVTTIEVVSERILPYIYLNVEKTNNIAFFIVFI